MSTNQRDAFEAWFSDNGELPLAVQQQGEGYRLMQAQEAWIAWNAAWQAATADTAALAASHARLLEELKEMVHHFGNPHPDEWLSDLAWREACESEGKARAAIAAAEGLTPITNQQEQ